MSIAFQVVLGATIVSGQEIPQGYFAFPIYPGKANSLSGVLGDLRSTHFHAGIDIRTQQREGLPVSASADGYVYKLGVQRSGYGNVIFLKHPNGYSTVYGHLQSFSGALGDFVRNEQYKAQTFEIELFPDSTQFPVKKGETIALSGNTGGSGGPHLHFEIRDRFNNYVNPLAFGFREIPDKTPPVFVNLALRPMNIESRLNGQIDRKTFKPIKLPDGTYKLAVPVMAKGTIGIELQAHDLMPGTGFKHGLYCIEVTVDGEEVFVFKLDSIPNRPSRYYNNLIDYAAHRNSEGRFLKCYDPEGNDFKIFRTDPFNGLIHIEAGETKDIQIRIYDSFNNSSLLKLKIEGEKDGMENNKTKTSDKRAEEIWTAQSGNILKVTSTMEGEDLSAVFYGKEKEIILDPVYYQSNASVYLLDLGLFSPDSVQIADRIFPLHYKDLISAGKQVTYQDELAVVKFSPSSLFNSLPLFLKKEFGILTVGEPYIALREPIEISYSPENVPQDKKFWHAYHYEGNSYSFIGGKWSGDSLVFKTRQLGKFVAIADSTGPVVKLLVNSPAQIKARIHDELSGIDSYRLRVNNEWVLMQYDYKTRLIWSDKLDKNKPFEGELLLEVTDKAGNSTILQTEINKPKK